MHHRALARRRRSTLLAALAILGLAGVASFVRPTLESTARATSSNAVPPTTGAAAAPLAPAPRPAEASPSTGPPTAVGTADGVVPSGSAASVFDDALPAVGRLDRDLLDALRDAATDAAAAGVRFRVNSGWRSTRYQQQLLQEAVVRYGSLAEAERWVATPETSAHVSGNAVDVGPSRAASWLAQHGARYGLCRTYRNEPWHYELRPSAVTAGCPRRYADPTEDPRMQA